MARKQQLPVELQSHSLELIEALAVPLLVAWDESDDAPDFVDAPQPEAIAKVLIQTSAHQHLVNASIGYLFRQKMTGRGVTIWAKASKVSGKLHHFSDLEFLIEVNWSQWKVLSDARRIALMDHELAHCGQEDTEKGSKWVMIPHDLEEFNAIARRWGSWRPSMAAFANALGEGQQLGLFTHD